MQRGCCFGLPNADGCTYTAHLAPLCAVKPQQVLCRLTSDFSMTSLADVAAQGLLLRLAASSCSGSCSSADNGSGGSYGSAGSGTSASARSGGAAAVGSGGGAAANGSWEPRL